MGGPGSGAKKGDRPLRRTEIGAANPNDTEIKKQVSFMAPVSLKQRIERLAAKRNASAATMLREWVEDRMRIEE